LRQVEDVHTALQGLLGGYNLGKSKLPMYDGNSKQWQVWWAYFEKAVHNNPSVEEPCKMLQLQQAAIGEAKRFMGDLDCANNYPVVIKRLQEKFGDPTQLINLHLAELRVLSEVSNEKLVEAKERYL